MGALIVMPWLPPTLACLSGFVLIASRTRKLGQFQLCKKYICTCACLCPNPCFSLISSHPHNSICLPCPWHVFLQCTTLERLAACARQFEYFLRWHHAQS